MIRWWYKSFCNITEFFPTVNIRKVAVVCILLYLSIEMHFLIDVFKLCLGFHQLVFKLFSFFSKSFHLLISILRNWQWIVYNLVEYKRTARIFLIVGLHIYSQNYILLLKKKNLKNAWIYRWLFGGILNYGRSSLRPKQRYISFSRCRKFPWIRYAWMKY